MAVLVNSKGAAKGALLGGLVAGVVNTGIYFAGRALGASYIPKDPAEMGQPFLPAHMPFVISMLAAVVAAAVIALLGRVAPKKAWPIFLGIAGVVFIVEGYLSPHYFDDLATVVALELMHVPAALGVLYGIHRFGVKPVA